MVTRHQAVAVSAVLGLLCSASLLAQRQPDAKAQAAAAAAQKLETAATLKLADDVAAGQNAPNDFGLAWMREDYLKAGPNAEYIPFIVTVDASKFTGGPVALYWRVVKAAAAGAAPAAPAPKTKYPYEDINFVPQISAAPGSAGAPTRIARAFSV